ncbi:MAG: hypothetical protein QOI77_1931 [Blastocatellia bacterium]|jgi:hypothetical protein|nr:hypothetical protein [Blastocatellia bacterium]
MRTKLKILSVMLTLLAAVPVEAVKVYRTKSEGLADVKVYVTSSEGLADCIIYVTSSEGLADGNAKWYYVNSEGLADVKVYFATSEGLADKKIYFTRSEGLAKCNVNWKGYKKSNAGYLFRSLDALQFSSEGLIRSMILPRQDLLDSLTVERLL